MYQKRCLDGVGGSNCPYQHKQIFRFWGMVSEDPPTPPTIILMHKLIQIRGFFYTQKIDFYFHFEAGADPGFGQGGAQLLRPKVADVAKRAICGQGPGPT